MRSTRVLLGTLVATAVVAGGCTGSTETTPEPEDRSTTTSSDPSSSATPEPEPVPVKRIRLEVAPGISQQGDKPAPSHDHVATAKVRPASADPRIVLQQRKAGGWKRVSRAAQDADGVATYDVRPDGATEYRAVATNPDGGTVRSNTARTEWEPIFREEFDGESLDSSKWSYRQLGLYNPAGSRQCSVSDESAVNVGGGTLELQVRPDPDRRGESCNTPKYGSHAYYLNGHISTEDKFAFTYGLAAARVKFQRGRGQHGAFWLQRAAGAPYLPGQPGVSGVEIDIVEYFGEGYQDGGLASFLFYLNSQRELEKVGDLLPKASKQLPPGDDWWKSYHVFSVEWSPDGYVFRVDGRETFRTAEGLSGVDEYVVLSLLSSDWELKRIKPKTLPSSMKVDWVRVWQR